MSMSNIGGIALFLSQRVLREYVFPTYSHCVYKELKSGAVEEFTSKYFFEKILTYWNQDFEEQTRMLFYANLLQRDAKCVGKYWHIIQKIQVQNYLLAIYHIPGSSFEGKTLDNLFCSLKVLVYSAFSSTWKPSTNCDIFLLMQTSSDGYLKKYFLNSCLFGEIVMPFIVFFLLCEKPVKLRVKCQCLHQCSLHHRNAALRIILGKYALTKLY